jgi:hypothetical protein
MSRRENPANFTMKTRATSASRNKDRRSMSNEPMALD